MAWTSIQFAARHWSQTRGHPRRYYAVRRMTIGCGVTRGGAATCSPSCMVFQSYENSLPQSRHATYVPLRACPAVERPGVSGKVVRLWEHPKNEPIQELSMSSSFS